MRIVLILFLVSVLSACSRSGPQAPNAVIDPQAVKTIVLASDTVQLATCEHEIRSAGGRILYRGENGLLFTDRTPAELRLAACAATVSANETLDLPRAADPGDLSTVMRLIPAEEIGARSFLQDHPSYDGRGVTIAVLDTGVELDHPLLSKTTTGADKIVDFQDFTGEGRVTLEPFTSGAYTAAGIEGTNFKFGTFAGSSLNKEGGDTYTDLGLLVYETGGKLRARLDTDGDKSFANEVELGNYAETHTFVKIGAKKGLAVGINIAPDLKSATLVFDDGSHGTHVAGIASGYDPNGLQGVAPGAQVMSLKIGDNRLSGGSTTTASMMLAIDYAAAHGAQVVNMSYGIRGGSNAGASAIDRYVDKIARSKGLIFSISAGNAGPGMLSVGTPGGAELAITNAAYLSKQTARDNYGYLGVQDDNTWYFSSVGPLIDGGWKPTLLAPGTAVSSVPLWSGKFANYRGTSMAAPEATGGLALLLSAAIQEKLPTDRISITQSVYAGAKPLANLAWIQQGHGLMNVAAALADLQTRQGRLPIEYSLSVNSPTAPGGKGKGIYLRSRDLPANAFTIRVTPQFLPDTATNDQNALKTYRLSATAPWIAVPGSFWLSGAANTFQAQIDASVLTTPGLHSEKIVAVEENTGRVAFEVPVTVVAPVRLDDSTRHRFATTQTVRVGQTVRHFLDVPAGTTALSVTLTTDGPSIFAQLLDPEGFSVADWNDPDRASPQAPFHTGVKISRGGVYELDVTASVTNSRPLRLQASVQAFSLVVTPGLALPGGGLEATVQNNFEAVRVNALTEVRGVVKHSVHPVTGDIERIPFTVTDADIGSFSKIEFRVKTSKATYDLMTDYPYLVLDAKGKTILSGGLELNTKITFDKLAEKKAGDFVLHVQGAFTEKAPSPWVFELTETRVFGTPITLAEPQKLLLEQGQFQTIALKAPPDLPPFPAGFTPCASLVLNGPDDVTLLETEVCR